MQLRQLILLIVGGAVLLLAGCSRAVDSITVHAEDGSARDLRIRERPGQPGETEGYFLSSTGASPMYRLGRPQEVADAGEVWSFAVQNAAHGFSVSIFSDDGTIVAQRTLGDLPAGSDDIVLEVVVPPGESVKSFQLTSDDSLPDPDPTRLVSVSRRMGTASAGVRRVGEDGLRIGPGSAALAWGDTRDGERTWIAQSVDPVLWPASSPVVVSYAYDPAAGRVSGSSTDASGSIAAGPALPTVRLETTDGAFEMRVRPGRHGVILYPNAEGVTAGLVSVRSTLPGLSVTGVTPTVPYSAGEPLPADLGTILRYPASLWRNRSHELFRWTLFPQVLVIDTADYATQARFFKRLAFFVEKEGFRGELLTDAELAGRHGYNAHNYNGEGLAAFFTRAAVQAFALSPEEELLRDIVLSEGIIARDGAGYAPGRGGILSISQESRGIPGLRELLVTHEAYHGVYYGDAEYVSSIESLWGSLTPDEKRFWLLFLDGMQYDTGDDYLITNEFQAYLLQQPVRSASWYFEIRSADRLRRWKPGEAAWIDSFLARSGDTFREQAGRANALLFEHTGLVAGDVLGLVPIE